MDRRSALFSLSALLAACASLPGRDPVKVQLAGLDSLGDSQGLEVRFLARLRVQNPNDTPVEFSGVAIDVRIRGSNFASGVSDASGTVPAFGETVVSVPVTVSAVNIARMVIGFAMANEPPQKVDYAMTGKLGGGPFGTIRFESRGEVNLPTAGGTRS